MDDDFWGTLGALMCFDAMRGDKGRKNSGCCMPGCLMPILMVLCMGVGVATLVGKAVKKGKNSGIPCLEECKNI